MFIKSYYSNCFQIRWERIVSWILSLYLFSFYQPDILSTSNITLNIHDSQIFSSPQPFFLKLQSIFLIPHWTQLDILAILQMQSNKTQILSAFCSFSWVLYCGKGATLLLICNSFLLLKSIRWPNSRDYISKAIPLVLHYFPFLLSPFWSRTSVSFPF